MKIDAVKMMRDARDRISRETWGMSSAELREYFREGSRRFEALMEKEAPGRKARLKALGIFETGSATRADGEPGADGAGPAKVAASAKPGVGF